ncbi:feruloyl esterase B precursor [Pyrenophora tritici-repentis Pt-1C-BFP]|uniref:Carboxylic ester hydrolase n=1 Tax=Pyrenophora tritici-repentis (strain Pt-1C-BFP) TaxID=426418 RepID=B2WM42_PYRTR|nr:feruloyl esterase B precursor [Pyrenophora tritici-repentis Pt-1C-BFP]EDU44102.1 feruloyl esterase B precursor [Pyrenophora tritici-repentis Pt-1C-BFP]
MPPPNVLCVPLSSLRIAVALDCSSSAIQAALSSDLTVNFASPLKANATFQVPQSDTGYPNSPVGLPALCAVSVQVPSKGNTTFGFGLFLPDDWNGRFLAVGNGGFAGGVNWEDMAAGVRYGFATMSTDTGHNSSTGDGQWAANEPNKVENWGHLAMHGSVVAGKAITSSYYKKDITYNYYSGCSTGGRQGLKEAEFYPEDFDGILAGAPAWWTSHLQPWTVKVALYNLPATADYHIPPALFPAIAKEVLKQCDPQDGLADNIISDPVGCNFRAEELLCGANVTNPTSAGCLTSPQISRLYKIYTDSIGENQTFLFPHLYPGSEGQWFLLSGNEPNSLGTDYVRYFLGLGKDWSFYDYNEDIQRLANQLQPGNASVGYDLSSFHAKGGKILSYHGMADGLIPTGSTPYYYNQVYQTLKPKGVDVDSFFRFFLVPGMGHCSGTTPNVNAPWYFAGANQAPVLGSTVYGVPGFRNKEHDALLSMVAWVEEGVAPDQIIGTKYVNEKTQAEVSKQRPLCMYPKAAKYKSTGDVNMAESWECKLLY